MTRDKSFAITLRTVRSPGYKGTQYAHVVVETAKSETDVGGTFRPFWRDASGLFPEGQVVFTAQLDSDGTAGAGQPYAFRLGTSVAPAGAAHPIGAKTIAIIAKTLARFHRHYDAWTRAAWETPNTFGEWVAAHLDGEQVSGIWIRRGGDGAFLGAMGDGEWLFVRVAPKDRRKMIRQYVDGQVESAKALINATRKEVGA